ncbi:siderophore ABC transporter substrate-binding protein [Idiomarina xiamenensis]|nr:ABC transporter substrate-binding protein [Idiomarina xiamenensis]
MFKPSVRCLAWLFVAVTSVTLAACDNTAPPAANESGRTLQHAQGQTVLPEQPQRVAVMDMAALDTLTLLDFDIAAVPQSGVPYPDFMQGYSEPRYTDAGTLFEPNFEQLSALDADVIIVGGRSREAYAALAELAPTVDLSIDFANVFDSLKRQTQQLGEVFQQQQAASDLISRFEQRVAAVKAQVPEQQTALVVMVVGGRLVAYGPGSRFGFVFDALGFNPATALESQGLHGNPMSPELILNANPDWLFVISRDVAIGESGAKSAKQVLDNQLVAQSEAWQKQQVLYLNSGEVYLAGGMQTYLNVLDDIEQALQQ